MPSIFENPAAAPLSPTTARRRRASPKNIAPRPRNRRVATGVIRSAADRQPLQFNLSGTARAQDPSQRLFQEFEKARQEGLQANKDRFQEILGGFRERLSTALSNLEGLGEQGAADINRSFDEFSANQKQDLFSERREDLFPSFQDVAGLAQNIGQQQGRSIPNQQMFQAMQQRRNFGPMFAQNFAGIQNALRFGGFNLR